jgi:hypothetical protein
MGPRVTFSVDVEMEERWAPQFLGMLREMQRLGDVGSSRMLRFYADGDGDYRPKFSWTSTAEPAASGDELTWDAG